MLKVSIKTKVLDFRRANFSLLRAQLGGILWEASTEDKGASEGWEFFQECFLGSTKVIHRQIGRARDPLAKLQASESAQNQETHTRDGKADK